MKTYGDATVDVCIIGSGAGGGPMALALSEAGASVVVLEKGPWLKAADFDHDEILNCRRNRWVPYSAEEPRVVSWDGAAPKKSGEGWIANCVGGGTVHMSGYVYRLHPEDFALSTRYGELPGANLADWPINYGQLAPYYDKVEREVGVSGKAGMNPFEPPRTGPYPFPALAANPLGALVDNGAKTLGWHPFETPRLIISKAKDGRGACIYCSFCGSYGCEVNAKSSSLAALLPGAVATGRCEIRPRSTVARIETNAAGRATGVVYFDADGQEKRVRARMVCVSATAIESARLLLNSTSTAFPQGLGNGGGLVGQNLTFSTLGRAFGTFERAALPQALRRVHSNHFLQRSIQDLYFIKARKGEYDKGGTFNFILPHRNPIFTADRIAKRGRPRLWGRPLMDALHRNYNDVHELEFEIFGEFLPSPKTYVTASSKVSDRWGLPVAELHVTRHPEALRNNAAMVKQGVALFEAAGASETHVDAVGATTMVLQHGTCRFGKDPTRSVLDPWCRSHEVDNLYVVDGSFMPTSGGVPTTLTIMANSFRVADHVVNRFKRREFGE